MEYNKTKKAFEKAVGVLGTISAVLCLIVSIVSIIVAFTYFCGAHDYEFGGYYERNAYKGAPYILVGLLLLVLSILMLILSKKLLKFEFLKNEDLRKRQTLRIWILVLSVLMGNLVVMGLMIAVLCLKDFKNPTTQQSAHVNGSNDRMMQQIADQKFYDFYDKVQEIKKLKSLGIIDETAYKKAVTKIVVDITKDE